jgi:hypothetical protein
MVRSHKMVSGPYATGPEKPCAGHFFSVYSPPRRFTFIAKLFTARPTLIRVRSGRPRRQPPSVPGPPSEYAREQRDVVAIEHLNALVGSTESAQTGEHDLVCRIEAAVTDAL